MFYHNINPVIARVLGFEVRWYGVIFALNVLLVYFLLKHLARERKIGLEEKDVADFVLYAVIGTVIGSRLFAVISELSYYLQNPVEIFALWHGGLAFHGGVLGLVIAGYLFCKKRNLDFWEIADITVIPVALALALGRIGNFINGEFYGTITQLPWGVYFKGVEASRHPVQLYESLKNLFIFGMLWNLKNKKLPKGTLFWFFILSYGILRFTLEYLKDLPHSYLGLTWGQFWSIPMIIAGVIMLANKYKQLNMS